MGIKYKQHLTIHTKQQTWTEVGCHGKISITSLPNSATLKARTGQSIVPELVQQPHCTYFFCYAKQNSEFDLPKSPLNGIEMIDILLLLLYQRDTILQTMRSQHSLHL